MQDQQATPPANNPIMENEIRIRSDSRVKNLLHYALKLLEARNQESIVIKATGNAIPKAITVAERVKESYQGLYQNTAIGDTLITDAFKNSDENDEYKSSGRTVSYIAITLSKNGVDESSPGYQRPDGNFPPVPDQNARPRGRRKGRVRNPRRNGQSQPQQSTQTSTSPHNIEGSNGDDNLDNTPSRNRRSKNQYNQTTKTNLPQQD